MKCILRKVDKGIICTIDERPKLGDWFYDTNHNKRIYNVILYGNEYSHHHKIIASNFGVGMDLMIQVDDFIILDKQVEKDFIELEKLYDKEYSYSIVDGKVVVEL